MGLLILGAFAVFVCIPSNNRAEAWRNGIESPVKRSRRFLAIDEVHKRFLILQGVNPGLHFNDWNRETPEFKAWVAAFKAAEKFN